MSDITIRICPARDYSCPHGLQCPYAIDRATCDIEASRNALNSQARALKTGDMVETVKGAEFWGRIIALDNDAESPGATVLAVAPGFRRTKHVYPLAQLQRIPPGDWRTGPDMERGTGRTTRQIMGLKPGDVFVIYPHSARWFYMDLIHQHRPDLKVGTTPVTVHAISENYGGEWFRGLNRRIVVDHHAATILTPQCRAIIEHTNARFPHD